MLTQPNERSLFRPDGAYLIDIIDQTLLPHELVRVQLRSMADVAHAIRSMQVRGAPLIGVTAAYGLALAMLDGSDDEQLQLAYDHLLATRPTAVNLRWALDEMKSYLQAVAVEERLSAALSKADELAEADIACCHNIGLHGVEVIEAVAKERAGRVNILTHCNAGALAVLDWGTALAPIYQAQQRGVDIHVWVDETRPRNQGAALTAWELHRHSVPHTIIADNVGGHLMQRGQVDLCIVGADRISADGYACNKIGTYLKALAAADNQLPFYVAAPTSTIDWQLLGDNIPIEERGAEELRVMRGRTATGEVVEVSLFSEHSPVANYAFDVTPPHLLSGIITEHGIVQATQAGLETLR